MPLPSRRLTALVVLGVIGPLWLSNDEPGREPPRMRLVPGEPGKITNRLALSPDGTSIATTRGDGRVSLRDIRDEGGSGRLLDQRGTACVLAFSPDGQTLALGRDQPGILLFDLAAGRFRTSLDAPLFQVSALAFSPDGQTLAAASWRHGGILLWDLIAGRARADPAR